LCELDLNLIQTTEVITEKDNCDEMQSKRRKMNVADNNDEDESDEKPPSTKQTLETLQVLCRGTQHRVDHYSLFEQHTKK